MPTFTIEKWKKSWLDNLCKIGYRIKKNTQSKCNKYCHSDRRIKGRAVPCTARANFFTQKYIGALACESFAHIHILFKQKWQELYMYHRLTGKWKMAFTWQNDSFFHTRKGLNRCIVKSISVKLYSMHIRLIQHPSAVVV